MGDGALRWTVTGRAVLATACSALLALGPTTALASDCFAGSAAYESGQLDDAIALFEDALRRGECVADRDGLLLSLATTLSRRADEAGDTADHCLAARRFSEAAMSSIVTVRERARTGSQLEGIECQVGQRLADSDAKGAMDALRLFAARHASSEDTRLAEAAESARDRIEALRAAYFGQVEVWCPTGGLVAIDGLTETRTCPEASWTEVGIGQQRIILRGPRGDTVTHRIEVQAGQTVKARMAFAPGARPEPAPAPVARNRGLSYTQIGLILVATGIGMFFTGGALLSLDDDPENDSALGNTAAALAVVGVGTAIGGIPLFFLSDDDDTAMGITPFGARVSVSF